MKKTKKKSAGELLSFSCFMLVGGCSGVMIMLYLDHLKKSGASFPVQILSFVLLLLSMYAAAFIQIVIHEAGHLIFGLLSGYRFCSFRVGNIMLVREKGHLAFKRFTLAGTGGQCLMGPPDIIDGKMPVMLYNFGGAILNAITALVCFLIAVLSLLPWSALFVFLIINSLFGIAFALLNGLPMKMGPVNNDGMNALDLAKDRDAARAFWIQMKVNELLTAGTRLKDMPEEWFSMPSDESMKNAIIATIGVFACNRLFDEHRFAEADDMIAELLSRPNGIIGLHRGLLVCDRIYMELINKNRTDVLSGFMTAEQTKIMTDMKSYPSVIRTEYARALLAEKDNAKAEALLGEFEKISGSYPYPCEIETERELMEIAMEIARNAAG